MRPYYEIPRTEMATIERVLRSKPMLFVRELRTTSLVAMVYERPVLGGSAWRVVTYDYIAGEQSHEALTKFGALRHVAQFFRSSAQFHGLVR